MRHTVAVHQVKSCVLETFAPLNLPWLQGATNRTKAQLLKPYQGSPQVLGGGSQASVVAEHQVNPHGLKSAWF